MKESNMYHGGAIFVDHASGYIAIRHQVSLGASDTIQAKLSYEQECFNSGVTVGSYHCDRGTFAAKDFVAALNEKDQSIRYSGANTGFQSGVSE